MEVEPVNQLERLEAKVDAIYKSVEKTRKYFQIVMWITVALVVLPLISMVFVVPALMSSYTAALDGLI